MPIVVRNDLCILAASVFTSRFLIESAADKAIKAFGTDVPTIM
jgi:hypothetical protein